MARNWKQQTHDLETDACPAEDVVDGFRNLPRQMQFHLDYSSHVDTKMVSRGSPFFPAGGTKCFVDEDTQLDSGLVCDSLDIIDSIKEDSLKDKLNKEARCSSIGEVDVELCKLSIHQAKEKSSSENLNSNRKLPDSEYCNSIDEAYHSGGSTLSSLPDKSKDVISIFSDQDQEGDSPAHLCLIHRKVDLFLQLLSTVPSATYLNVQNFLQQTLLHLAVILELPKVVRELVARGAVIDLRDRLGNTPLHIACSRGDLRCVLALTTPVEPCEVKSIPYTMGYHRIPQNQDIMNYEGLTCVHLAASGSHITIVNHLITKCYADINVQEGRSGQTILHQAVENNNIDLVKYLLLHRNLNLEAARYDGSTALSLAQGRWNQQLVNLLINAGSEVSVSNTDCEQDCEDSMEQSDSVKDEFSYDDFKIGGSLVSM